MKIQKERGK